MYFQKAAVGRAKRERTRGIIIDSAIEAFSHEGISNARVSNIAEQAGITGATFYNHFRDKDDLTAATGAAIILEVSQVVAKEIEDLQDPVVRVTALCSCVLKILLTQENWATIVVESFHYLRSIRNQVTQALSDQIQMGIDRNVFTAELNDFLVEQIASLMMSSIRNQMETGYSERNTELTCEHVLRVLGLSRHAASKAVARWRPQLQQLEGQPFSR